MAMQDQRWNVKTKSGSVFEIITRLGVGPQAAVEAAGYMMSEIESIVANGIVLQEDMRGWRAEPGYLCGSNGAVVL